MVGAWFAWQSTARAACSDRFDTELADNLRTLPLELEGVDQVAAAADAVGYASEQAATLVTKHARISRRIAASTASTENVACLICDSSTS